MSQDKKDETNPADRRTSPRHTMVLRVEYKNSSEYLTSWTENVSAGGFFVRTEETFAMGQRIKVALSFPGLLKSIDLEGTVTWIRESSSQCPGGIGVRVDSDRGRRKLAAVAMAASNKERKGELKGTYEVLLVEDNEFQRQACERVLNHLSQYSSSQVNLTMVYNGHEALQLLKTGKRCDLLITDLKMPVMDGTSMIRTMKEDNELDELPIIVITGDVDRRVEVEQLGVDAFMEKPIKFSDLLETVVYLIHLGNITEV